jgi:Ser/Thr protein kinase RdoA (MazF antagonist)
MPVRGP